MKPENSFTPLADEEALSWATRLDGGDLTPAELATLDAWLACDPSRPWRLAHYQQLFAQLHGTLPAMVAAGVLRTESGDLPDALTDSPSQRPRARRGWLRWTAGMAVAASLTVGAMLWSARPVTISTSTAQRQSITLADGTRTDLNARTRLSVDLRADSRRVRMEQGEAVFSVTKDPSRPFYVETPLGTVRVTGTVFDVRVSASGSLEVTVLEGHVVVKPIDAAGHEIDIGDALTVGEHVQFRSSTGGVQRTHLDSAEDVVAWREGRVVFAGTPLREALERFADYHGRRISVAPEAAELQVGGRYTLDDLEQFADSLEPALHVRVIHQGDGGLRVVAAPGRR